MTTTYTSALAHEKARNLLRWGSQRHRLLQTYAASRRKKGMTDEEVAKLTGLYRPGCMYWARCSELRTWGLTEVVGTATSSHDETVQACVITDAGRELLAMMRAKEMSK